MQFDYVDLLVLLACVGNLFVAFNIYYRAPRSRSNDLFLWLVFTVFLWCVAIFFYRKSDINDSVFFAQILYAVACLAPVASFLFSLYFPEKKVNPLLPVIAVIANIIMFVACFWPGVIVKDVFIPENGEKIIYWGRYYFTYVIYQNIFFGSFFLTIFIQYKKSRGRTKNQLLAILAGALFTVFGAFITNLFLPSLGYFDYNWMGQVLTFIWVSFVTYAIVKHRLMDISLAIRRLIARLLTIVVVYLFFLLVYLVYAKLYSIDLKNIALIILFWVATAVSIGFNSLNYYIRKATDKVLFTAIYDRNKLLKELGVVLSSTLGFEDVMPRLYEVLSRAMHVKYVNFALRISGRVDLSAQIQRRQK